MLQGVISIHEGQEQVNFHSLIYSFIFSNHFILVRGMLGLWWLLYVRWKYTLDRMLVHCKTPSMYTVTHYFIPGQFNNAISIASQSAAMFLGCERTPEDLNKMYTNTETILETSHSSITWTQTWAGALRRQPYPLITVGVTQQWITAC